MRACHNFAPVLPLLFTLNPHLLRLPFVRAIDLLVPNLFFVFQIQRERLTYQAKMSIILVSRVVKLKHLVKFLRPLYPPTHPLPALLSTIGSDLV